MKARLKITIDENGITWYAPQIKRYYLFWQGLSISDKNFEENNLVGNCYFDFYGSDRFDDRTHAIRIIEAFKTSPPKPYKPIVKYEYL